MPLSLSATCGGSRGVLDKVARAPLKVPPSTQPHGEAPSPLQAHPAHQSTNTNTQGEGARARTERAAQDGAKQVGLPGRR